jgi:hypothetical protein
MREAHGVVNYYLQDDSSLIAEVSAYMDNEGYIDVEVHWAVREDEATEVFPLKDAKRILNTSKGYEAVNNHLEWNKPEAYSCGHDQNE